VKGGAGGAHPGSLEGGVGPSTTFCPGFQLEARLILAAQQLAVWASIPHHGF
jgi:hypothetical protein